MSTERGKCIRLFLYRALRCLKGLIRRAVIQKHTYLPCFFRTFNELFTRIKEEKRRGGNAGYGLLLKNSTYRLYAEKGERMDANLFFCGDSIRRNFHKKRYLFAVNMLKEHKNIRFVLDAACGLGYGARLVSDALGVITTGADANDRAVKYARGFYGGQGCGFRRVDLCRGDSFKQGEFDAAVSFETIEHLEEPQVFLRNLSFWLKINAPLIISTPNNWGDRKYHLFNYTYDAFKEHLKRYFIIDEIFVQNSGSMAIVHNHGQPSRLVKADAENVKTAEVFIAVCKNRQF